MAVTTRVFARFLDSLLNGEVDYDTNTIKAMLCSSTYVPNQDTHRYKSSVTDEVSGAGYTAGGVTLGSKTVTYDAATNTHLLDAADPSWTGATFTARYCVIYKDTGTAASSPLIAWIDFGQDETVTAGIFTVILPSGGFASLTTAA